MIERLPNGLTLGFRQMPGRRTVRICVASRMGARHEKKSESGLTHFCEHALLGGTKDIDSSIVKREIEQLGGGLNAFTAHDMISIEGDFAEKDFTRALDLMVDLFFQPSFTKDYVDQERRVILQEIAESRDCPWESATQGACDLFYRGKGVGSSILGEEKDLKRFKTKQLKDHWRKVSATGNCIVHIIGNIDAYHFGYARESCSHLCKEAGVSTPKTRVYPGKRSVEQQDKDLVYISMLFEAPSPEDEEARIKTEVLSSVLGDGVNSRIWRRVREKMGAAYDARSSVCFFRKNGHLELRAALDPKKWEMAMGKMIEELRKVAERGPYKKEIDGAIKGLMCSTLIMEDDPSTMAIYDVEDMCSGNRRFTFDDRKSMIAKVTPKDVQDVAASIFESGEPTIHVLGPVDSDFFS